MASCLPSKRGAASLWLWLVLLCTGCHVHACAGDDKPRALLQELARVRMEAGETPGHAAIRPDGRGVALAGQRGPIRLWQLESDKRLVAEPVWAVREPLASLQWANANWLLIAPESGRVHIADVATRAPVLEHRFHAQGRLAGLSPDGRYLAFGGSVLDREQREELGKPETVAWQSALAFARNASRLVIAGLQDANLVVRDLPSGATRSFSADGKIDAATLSPDGGVVAAALRGGKLQLWRQPDGAALRDLSGPEAARALFYVAGGARLVVAHEAGVCVYDPNNADELYFSRVDTRLLSFAFDGDLLAAASVEGEVLLWDVAQGALLGRARLGTQPVNAVAVSAAHKLLLAADSAGAVALWRLGGPRKN